MGNVVADALSRKFLTLAAMTDGWMILKKFRDLDLDVLPDGETI